MFFAARAANFYLVLLHEAADIGNQHLRRALEAELAALRDRQAQNNGKHPNHNRK